MVSRIDDDKEQLEQKRQELVKKGIEAKVLHNPVHEVSSTIVRNSLVKDGFSHDLPTSVMEYIKANQLYTDGYDPQDLRCVVKPLVRESRYIHTLGVEQQARQLANIYGVDEKKAAIGGVLHDICKHMEPDYLVQIILDSPEKDSYPCEEELRKTPQLLHSYAGGIYVRNELGITDQEMIDAIRYHTTGRADMTTLEKIIYLADFTSAERDYPDVEVLRNLVKISLDESMAYALEFVQADLTRRGLAINRDTQEAYKQYSTRKEQ